MVKPILILALLFLTTSCENPATRTGNPNSEGEATRTGNPNGEGQSSGGEEEGNGVEELNDYLEDNETITGTLAGDETDCLHYELDFGSEEQEVVVTFYEDAAGNIVCDMVTTAYEIDSDGNLHGTDDSLDLEISLEEGRPTVAIHRSVSSSSLSDSKQPGTPDATAISENIGLQAIERESEQEVSTSRLGESVFTNPNLFPIVQRGMGPAQQPASSASVEVEISYFASDEFKSASPKQNTKHPSQEK